MTTYPGVVTLDQDAVQVTIGLDTGQVRLVAGDLEIGVWSDEDCTIRQHSDGRWVIEAEEESLPFTPDDPEVFARGLLGDENHGKHEGDPIVPTSPTQTEGPPAKPLTLAGFYAISAVTAVLGLWALISLFT